MYLQGNDIHAFVIGEVDKKARVNCKCLVILRYLFTHLPCENDNYYHSKIVELHVKLVTWSCRWLVLSSGASW